MQLEPAALRSAERTHPIGATRRGDTADLVEEPDGALKRVVTILRRGEPPDPVTRPRQDHPERDQRDVPSEPGGPAMQIAEIELGFLARCGVDRNRHSVRCFEPRATNIAHRANHGRIAAVEPVSSQLVVDRDRQHPRMRSEQHSNRVAPPVRHHRGLGRTSRRRRPVLQVSAHRRAMEPGLFGDLLDRPSLRVQVVDIHVHLLGHHGERHLRSVLWLGRSTRWRCHPVGWWMPARRPRHPCHISMIPNVAFQ